MVVIYRRTENSTVVIGIVMRRLFISELIDAWALTSKLIMYLFIDASWLETINELI